MFHATSRDARDSHNTFYHILNRIRYEFDIREYKCKIDTSDSESNSNIYLIYKMGTYLVETTIFMKIRANHGKKVI